MYTMLFKRGVYLYHFQETFHKNIIIPVINFIKIMSNLISLKDIPYSQSWIYRTKKNIDIFGVSFSGSSLFHTKFSVSDEVCILRDVH
jgi:hypothetical protein